MNLERIVGRTGWDKTRFVISVCMDLIGNGSYLSWLLGPGVVLGEGSDVVFAPIQAAYLLVAYHRWDTIGAALVGGIEEIMPGTDAVPTCTMYHIYTMRKKYGAEPESPRRIEGAQPAK
jgi:hypothetical protein